MFSFLGSGSQLLDRSYQPTHDHFDSESDDEEFEDEKIDEFLAAAPLTLEDVGYSFTPFGGVIVHSKMEKVDAVWKKSKLPRGTVLPKMAEDECGICFTTVDSPADMAVTSCGHRYCRECLAYYLHLESGDINNLHHVISKLETTESGSHHLRIRRPMGVRCPHPTCSEVIEGQEFQSFVEKETWERFVDLALLVFISQLRKEGDITPCSAKGCEGVVQQCICSSEACRKKSSGQSKREKARYAQWLFAERNSLELFKKWSIGVGQAKQCPHCNVLIEKNGGCNNMFCSRCKKRFDWSSSTNPHGTLSDQTPTNSPAGIPPAVIPPSRAWMYR